MSATTPALFAPAQFDNQVWQAELSGRSDDNEQFGRHNTWQTGAGWRFVEDYRLSARYGTGFRAPFNDLYYPGSSKPGAEAGRVEEQRADAGWPDRRRGWRVTGYRNDFEQMIQWAPDSQGMWTPQNVGKARIEGSSWKGSSTPAGWTHRISAEYKDPRTRSPTSSCS